MSLEFNKVAGAFLGTLTFVMGVGFVAELIFEQEPPEKPGFEVAAAEGEAQAEGGGEEAAAVEPIAVRLAAADPAKGEGVAKACATCHDLSSANTNKAGPGLWNIVGRKPAGHEGFAYSPAMVEYSNTHAEWNWENLDHFLASPKAEVPGTKMGYAGVKKPDDRASLIAYLRTLSDSPLPLPAADAAPAAEAPAAPAAEAPAAEAPAAEAPAAEAPAAEAPAAEAPAAEAPAAPAAEAPAAPAAEAPAPAAPAQPAPAQ
jgi:cytochrome c